MTLETLINPKLDILKLNWDKYSNILVVQYHLDEIEYNRINKKIHNLVSEDTPEFVKPDYELGLLIKGAFPTTSHVENGYNNIIEITWNVDEVNVAEMTRKVQFPVTLEEAKEMIALGQAFIARYEENIIK